MRVLVTGASGVAAKGLHAIQSQFNHEFIFSDSKACDLRNAAEVDEYFNKLKPDGVINFAAVSGGIGLSGSRNASMFRDNILINVNVFEASRKFGVKKLVACLTTGMYPPDAKLPLCEETMHQGEPHGSNYGSSFAKRMIEPMIRGYRDEYSLDCVGLIPNGIFGPHDNFHPEHAPMLPAQILNVLKASETGSDIVVWGDGKPLREYTFSYDIARAFVWALDNYSSEKVLNCGTTEELKIQEIIEHIADYFNVSRDRIVYDTNRPNGVFKKSVSNEKFVSLTNFQYTPFAEGLRHTCEWLKENISSPSFRYYEKTKG